MEICMERRCQVWMKIGKTRKRALTPKISRWLSREIKLSLFQLTAFRIMSQLTLAIHVLDNFTAFFLQFERALLTSNLCINAFKPFEKKNRTYLSWETIYEHEGLVEKIGTFVRCKSSKKHASSWNYPIYLER